MSEHNSTRKLKYTYLEPNFICTSCKKLRDHEIREKGRNRCLICSGYRKHQQRVNTKTFQEFELNFFESKRLQLIGKFKCSGCNQELDQSLNNQGKGKCRPCDLEYKRQNRANKAEATKKHFIPRALYCSHVEEYKKTFVLDSHYIAYKKSFIHDAHVKTMRKSKIIYSGYKLSNEYKYKNMSDDEVKQYFDSIGKPWNNPRLSKKERYKIKYNNNIEFRLLEITRTRINRKIKRRDIDFKIRRSLISSFCMNVYNDLGYTFAELKDHLESNFTDGMSWDYFFTGEIHIDHIIPIGLFNLDTEVSKCWALKNLQPLWSKDNRSKSDKLPDGRSCSKLTEEEREVARALYITW